MTPDNTPSAIDKLYKELDTLSEKNDTKKSELNQNKRQMEEAVKRRDALNEEVKRTSEEIRKLRANRDSLNVKVKELKAKRDNLRAVASQKREVLSKLLEQAKQISEQLHGTFSEISRQIQGLDWFIQTNPLSVKAERNLVSKISALEVSLAKHKGLRNVRDKLLQLRVEVGALRIQAQATHEELTKIAEESEKIHAAMQGLVKTLAERKKQADLKHEEYLEHGRRRRDIILEIKQNLQRINQIRDQIGEAKTLPKLKGEMVKSKYKKAANEKIRTGGKLSFEEFQALMEDNETEDDD